jgi:hypothetical protein
LRRRAKVIVETRNNLSPERLLGKQRGGIRLGRTYLVRLQLCRLP